MSDQETEAGFERQEFPDVVGDAGGGASSGFAPIPFTGDIVGQQHIGHVSAKAEFLAGIGREGAAVGAREAVEHRVGAARGALIRIGVVSREGGVVAADDLAIGGAQILDIAVADEAA